MRTFEEYLIILGERNLEYGYDTKLLVEHLEYFRKSWKDNFSTRKALEFFWFELNGGL